MNKPWVNEESKQLFQLMEAGCHFKMDNLDKGLELMKEARDIAPWMGAAKDADASIRSITGNLATLRELWEKKQAGDKAAAKACKEGSTIMPSPAIFNY